VKLNLRMEHDAVSPRKVTIHLPREDGSTTRARVYKLYVLDKCDRDIRVIADHLYRRDPVNRNKEHRLDVLGIVHRGIDNDELRMATGIGYGHVQNTFASVETPVETIDAIDQEALKREVGSIGKAHLHPFPNGESFLSGQDRNTLESFATIDPGHLAIIINPLTLQYRCYRWDFTAKHEERVEPTVLRSDPIIIADQTTKEPQVIQSTPRLKIKAEHRTETLTYDPYKFLTICGVAGSAILAFLAMQSATTALVRVVSAGIASGLATSLVILSLHEASKWLRTRRETGLPV